MKKPSLDYLVVGWQGATIQQRQAALLALQSEPATPTATIAEEILPRAKAAKRFHRHPSFLDRAVRAGLIEPVRMKGRTRSCGFRASDIERLMAGGNAT